MYSFLDSPPPILLSGDLFYPQLAQSRVLIIGMGGLGAPVTLHLARAGVGHLTLVDSDKVELSNLQRQIIHTNQDLGQWKVESARQKIRQLAPQIQIRLLPCRLETDLLSEQVSLSDVIVDCTDNFNSRFAINQACLYHKKPLVSGAALRFAGQLTVFLLQESRSPCYHCLYPDTPDMEMACHNNGIISPLVGVIGSLQALEVIKILLNLGKTLCGRLLLIDAYNMQRRILTLNKDPLCPSCSTKSPSKLLS